MYRRYWFIVPLVIILALAVGCTTVTRVEVEQMLDLSGRWNDTDSRLVADAMIDDCMNRKWTERFLQEKGRKPVIIVGTVLNNTHEHINTDVFVKDLETALLNSEKITFVASAQERMDQRAERDNQQQGYTNPGTIKEIGQETGADYMLTGTVNSVKDELRNQYVILYQTNMELINLENNEKLWIGQSKLKKVVHKSRYSL